MSGGSVVWWRLEFAGAFVALVICGATILAGRQDVPANLPDDVRAHLREERFEVVTSVRGLPLGVRDTLQALFGGPLDIAEPGAEWQRSSADLTPGRPLRRLVAAGCSIDHCLVHYERGGAEPTWRVLVFHWTPAGTRVECGGEARRGLTTLDALSKAVLSGRAIAAPATIW